VRLRRGARWLALLAALWLAPLTAVQADRAAYPAVSPGRPMSFPGDHGAHPQYRLEWWYVTGWLQGSRGQPLGFQVTFFRSRPNIGEANPSRFAASQLLFAHAALSDPAQGHLIHEQRSARAGFGLAEAASGNADVHIGDWSLLRHGDESYRVRIRGREMQFDLKLVPTQPPWPQGDGGYSRKGRVAGEASYYYSQPQLRVSGTLGGEGQRQEVQGRAWLDHEWSSSPLPAAAVGWDWLGINLDDGGALMAFRIRDGAGRALWSYASRRRSDGRGVAIAAGELSLVPLRRWRSARTGAEYPVALHVVAGDMAFDLLPLQDDQELDARASTGNVYWEGAVSAVSGNRTIGRGYLELTGYFRPLKL